MSPKNEISPIPAKKTVYFKSIATKLIISKVSDAFAGAVAKEKVLISKYAWEALNKLADIVPTPFRKVIANIELQPQIWKEVILRANINLKDELITGKEKVHHLGPPKLKRNNTGITDLNPNNREFSGIKLPLDTLRPLEVLTTIKYIRPDALEYVAKTMIAKVRHSSFYYISKQNLETFARVSTGGKPNIVLFAEKKWNPAELIELAANRNRVRLIRLCLGLTKTNEILDLVSTAAGSGSWLLLENLHLVKKKNLREILKKISYEMEWNNNDTKFRVWFTYQVTNKKFSECSFNKKLKEHLRPLFRTCTKYFVNKSSQIQQSLNDFFQTPLNEFFQEVDQEAGQKAPQTKKGFQTYCFATIAEHRQKAVDNMAIRSEGFSLETFVNRNKNAQRNEKNLKHISENKNSVKYAISFFLSVLRIRENYDELISTNVKNSSVFNYSEYDISYRIDDFFSFLNKHPLNIYPTFKQFFNQSFDESGGNWFSSYSPLIFGNFYKEILEPIETHKHVEINVKKSNYLLLPLGRNQNKDIFEYIINTPPEDPIEIFGFNRNHEFQSNYQRSKSFFDYVVRNHYDLENTLSLQKEATYLNDISAYLTEQDLNQSIKDFLEFLSESFNAPMNSSLLNLINLLNKILKIMGDHIELEKIELFQQMFEENQGNNENPNDISLLDDPDEKYEENYEESLKNSSKMTISKLEKSQKTFDTIKPDALTEKNVLSLNFGKSSQMLKKKGLEMNEFSKSEGDGENENEEEKEEGHLSSRKIEKKNNNRNLKFSDVIFFFHKEGGGGGGILFI